jgi:glycine cleavage system H protein
MNIPQDLLYTKEHEWIKISGDTIKMGISDYAQSSLGDITFVELPNVGLGCAQFKQIASVESVKAASDIYAPISGKVSKVNEVLATSPELLNQSPYDQGWMLEIQASDLKEKDNLMDSSAYEKYIKGLAH